MPRRESPLNFVPIPYRDPEIARVIAKADHTTVAMLLKLAAHQWAEGSVPLASDGIAEICGTTLRKTERAMEDFLSAVFPPDEYGFSTRANVKIAALRAEKMEFSRKQRERVENRYKKANRSYRGTDSQVQPIEIPVTVVRPGDVDAEPETYRGTETQAESAEIGADGGASLAHARCKPYSGDPVRTSPENQTPVDLEGGVQRGKPLPPSAVESADPVVAYLDQRCNVEWKELFKANRIVRAFVETVALTRFMSQHELAPFAQFKAVVRFATRNAEPPEARLTEAELLAEIEAFGTWAHSRRYKDAVLTFRKQIDRAVQFKASRAKRRAAPKEAGSLSDQAEEVKRRRMQRE